MEVYKYRQNSKVKANQEITTEKISNSKDVYIFYIQKEKEKTTLEDA